MPRNKRAYDSPPAMGGDSTKRVRFNSDDEDLTGENGELDFPTQKPRRGAVKDTSGYADDSSDEDEAHPKPSAANADDEDDMFGSTSAGGAGLTSGMPDLDAKDNDTRVKDSGLRLTGEAAKGGKEFLDLGDIEGQEFSNSEAYSSANKEAREARENMKKVYEGEEDYVEGEEHANDDDAFVPKERKSADGMGFAMSSFNMQEEMQEGRFTADGSYQANSKDPDSVHDQWLNSLTTKDLEAAHAAKQRQDAIAAKRTAELEKVPTRIECLKALIEGNGGLVKPGESVQGALARLGTARKAEVEAEKERLKKERRAQGKTRPKKDFDAPDDPSSHHPSTAQSANDVETHDIDLDPMAPPRPTAGSIKGKAKAKENASPTKQAIDLLSTLASTLLGTYGETAIYEETHEGIIRQLVAEAEVPRGWKPNNGESTDAATEGDPKIEEIKPQRKGLISRPVISRPKS